MKIKRVLYYYISTGAVSGSSGDYEYFGAQRVIWYILNGSSPYDMTDAQYTPYVAASEDASNDELINEKMTVIVYDEINSAYQNLITAVINGEVPTTTQETTTVESVTTAAEKETTASETTTIEEETTSTETETTTIEEETTTTEVVTQPTQRETPKAPAGDAPHENAKGVPPTGDTSQIWLYTGLFAAALAAMILLIFARKKID